MKSLIPWHFMVRNWWFPRLSERISQFTEHSVKTANAHISSWRCIFLAQISCFCFYSAEIHMFAEIINNQSVLILQVSWVEILFLEGRRWGEDRWSFPQIHVEIILQSSGDPPSGLSASRRARLVEGLMRLRGPITKVDVIALRHRVEGGFDRH